MSKNKPKHIMIQEYIKNKIKNGEWPAGSKLPTQRELASNFGVNRSTIIAALDELKAQGLIQGKMGSSVKVVQNIWNDLSVTTPNWNEFVKWSVYPENDPIVQKINIAETDPSFLHLSKGEIGIELHPKKELSKAFSKAGNNVQYYGYGDGQGSLSLRKALSNYLAARGVLVSPDSILIVSGSLQALQLISLGLLQPGSTVYLEEPSYLYTTNVFRSVGMKLKGIPIDKNGYDINRLHKEFFQSSKSVIYTNPTFHNPTGTVMTLDQRKEVLHICQENNLPLIEDDIYYDLWFEEAPPSPIKKLDKQGHVLYIGSFSKTIDPGLRIGWLVGPQEVVQRLADIRLQFDYGTSLVSQTIVENLLTSGLYDNHLKRIRIELKNKRDFLIDLLTEYLNDEVYWDVPKGGFFIWIHFKKPINSKELFMEAFKRKVLINPISIYQGGFSGDTIRLSFSYPTYKQMKQGIKILKDIINS